MTPTLECPHAKYVRGMRILCRRFDDLCAHQRYLQCKGWCVLTEQAKRCPARRGDLDGADNATAPNGGD